MLKNELEETILNGENSGVECKRDDTRAEKLAKVIAALANFEGGKILLGVEGDGTVSGLTKSKSDVEQWVMNLCRENPTARRPASLEQNFAQHEFSDRKPGANHGNDWWIALIWQQPESLFTTSRHNSDRLSFHN